ncbi:MAG: phosphatidylserine decarboxylase family protein [Candidatus Marinimicrobia bacterium]|nr:phosphatidylserine decarboxylase family protein [Candidatus Neomarinimicrobiota bacterium]MCF7829703.1 phosphatidylserine decarboxylase family protein [Candidatus Neomarinimicrobiota bacterium]MCF7881653.1 phosphatidylserine decarboxylase family protein [Candidatus Neomarinimicrobiota bacterium]
MAKEGYPIIGIIAGITIVFGIIMMVYDSTLWMVLFSFGVVMTLFSLYFFRDPERNVPNDPSKIISPADGRIVAIQPFRDDYVGEEAIRISIFLNIFNVHVNRVPCSGSVVDSRYRPGKFLAAFNERTSEENEQTIIDLKNKRFKVRVKQIAGLIARRIVNHLKPGDSVVLGQRFGLIRFGSRVDVIVPKALDIQVGLKQKVYGGETVLGEWNEI